MFRWMRRQARQAALLVIAALAIAPLQGCGTTDSSVALPSQTAKHVILIVGDGMQLEHERAANRYLFGNTTSGLAHWNFDYQGAATTWDVTTYNRYAYTAGKPLFSGNGSVADHSSFDPINGYDPSRGGSAPYPRSNVGDVAYYGTKLASSAGGSTAYPATDSASAATALATGTKTDDGNLAWRTGDPEDGRLTTIAEMYRNQRKASIGVITTVPFSHATPAGFVSHNKSRNNYQAISSEIINSIKPEVVIGGGHPLYNSTDPAKQYQYIADQEYQILRNNTEYAFAERMTGVNGAATLAAKADEAARDGKKLFGLFGGLGGNFEYHKPTNDGSSVITRGSMENPTLAEASTAALKVLSTNQNGFFLMIEQGDIDWSNHADDFAGMIGGVWDLNEAVKAVEAYVDQTGDDITWGNTLVIVTSDHGNSYMRISTDPAKQLSKGKLPNQAANFPGSGYDPGVAWYYPDGEVTYGFDGKGVNSHTNETVTVYARGALNSLFKSVEGSWYPGTKLIDNTHIYQVILKAMRLKDENLLSSDLFDTVYALPDTSIQVLNPLLTDQQLSDALINGAKTTVKPGIGSGLVPDPSSPGSFFMLTDRGINEDYTGPGDPTKPAGGKTFPLPQFTPTITKVHFTTAGSIVIDKVMPILDNNGDYVTGISNNEADDTPYLNQTATTALPYNENGLDTEDLTLLPNGDFLIVDEYAPSIFIVDGSTCKVKVRYTPAGKTLPNANYTVRAILPSILGQRRLNRGFESLALSGDGRTAYAVLQSPLGDKADSRYKNTRVVRIIRLDLSVPLNASVTGHFVVLQSDKGDYAKNIAEFSVSNKQTDLKYSAASWLAQDRILLLERANGKAKLMSVDMAYATNMLGASYENTLDPEDTTTAGLGLAGRGIVPASTLELFSSDEQKKLVTDTADTSGATPSYELKLEGMALEGDKSIFLANDNDFGIADPALTSKVWKLSPRNALPR